MLHNNRNVFHNFNWVFLLLTDGDNDDIYRFSLYSAFQLPVAHALEPKAYSSTRGLHLNFFRISRPWNSSVYPEMSWNFVLTILRRRTLYGGWGLRIRR